MKDDRLFVPRSTAVFIDLDPKRELKSGQKSPKTDWRLALRAPGWGRLILGRLSIQCGTVLINQSGCDEVS